VDVKFTRGGPKLSSSARTALGGKDVRMPYNTDLYAQGMLLRGMQVLTTAPSPHRYAQGMLRADFCVLPRGDEADPGRRLLDAVAAGCVPMIIGDTIRLPLAPLIAYKNFTVRVPESEFLRDPHAAVNEVLTTALHTLMTSDCL
jgi:hypothetical protein